MSARLDASENRELAIALDGATEAVHEAVAHVERDDLLRRRHGAFRRRARCDALLRWKGIYVKVRYSLESRARGATVLGQVDRANS
jgi:hypothetical protein